MGKVHFLQKNTHTSNFISCLREGLQFSENLFELRYCAETRKQHTSGTTAISYTGRTAVMSELNLNRCTTFAADRGGVAKSVDGSFAGCISTL